MGKRRAHDSAAACLGQEKQKRKREKQSLPLVEDVDCVERKRASETSDEGNHKMEINVGSSNNSSESWSGENFGTVSPTAEPQLKICKEHVAPLNEIMSLSGAFDIPMVKNHKEASVIQKTYKRKRRRYKRKKQHSACQNDLAQSMLAGKSTFDLHVNSSSVLETAESYSKGGNLDEASIDPKIDVAFIVGKDTVSSSSILGIAAKDTERISGVEVSVSNNLMPLIENENNATADNTSAASNKSYISSKIDSNFNTEKYTSTRKRKQERREKKVISEISQSNTEFDPDRPSTISSSSPGTVILQLVEREDYVTPTRNNLIPLTGIDDHGLTKFSDGNLPKLKIFSPLRDSNSSEVENPSLIRLKETQNGGNNKANCLEFKSQQLQNDVTVTAVQVNECGKADSSEKASASEKVKKRRNRSRRKKKVKHMIPEDRASEDALVQKNEGCLMPLSINKNENLESPAVIPGRPLRSHARRKLLVFDLNGLLCDVVFRFRGTSGGHKVGKNSVFKRPFCDDFLKFCFERFDVGVWSSRKRNNVDGVVGFLMGDITHKLLFCWDVSKCTYTGFKTIENRHKPLFLKELKKLWNKDEDGLPWQKGEYLPSNTLLVDDSPYKALCNPPHTAIFPQPYSYNDENDASLGPGGDLRVYLQGLAMADDVQSYVQEHPFGQQAITATSASWQYYHQIINRIENSSAVS